MPAFTPAPRHTDRRGTTAIAILTALGIIAFAACSNPAAASLLDGQRIDSQRIDGKQIDNTAAHPATGTARPELSDSKAFAVRSPRSRPITDHGLLQNASNAAKAPQDDTVSDVPEPTTAIIIGVSLTLLGFVRLRRRR